MISPFEQVVLPDGFEFEFEALEYLLGVEQALAQLTLYSANSSLGRIRLRSVKNSEQKARTHADNYSPHGRKLLFASARIRGLSLIECIQRCHRVLIWGFRSRTKFLRSLARTPAKECARRSNSFGSLSKGVLRRAPAVLPRSANTENAQGNIHHP